MQFELLLSKDLLVRMPLEYTFLKLLESLTKLYKNSTIESGDSLALVAMARICESGIPRIIIAVSSSLLRPLTMRNLKSDLRAYSAHVAYLPDTIRITS